MKNFVVGLLAMVGLAIAGLILYGVGSLIVGLIGIVVTVVVAVAPFVLGAASVIFIVFGGAYALGKAILESGKDEYADRKWCIIRTWSSWSMLFSEVSFDQEQEGISWKDRLQESNTRMGMRTHTMLVA